VCAGKAILRRPRDGLRSLEYISQYVASRDYLIGKAAHFLTKALLAFKVDLRLPADSDMVTCTQVSLH
jgi:hypothetical protein